MTAFESARFILEDGQTLHALPKFAEDSGEGSVDPLFEDTETM